MSNDDHLLPVRKIKNALQRYRDLTEALIPEQFSGTTDLARSTESLRSFETSEHAGMTQSEVLTAYGRWQRVGSRIEPDTNRADDVKGKLLPIEAKRLEMALARNSLEAYRQSKGLDKLREQLINSVIEAIDFTRGVEALEELIDKRGLMKKHEVEVGLAAERGQFAFTPLEKVRMCFPDLNAEEVAWLSVAKLGGNMLIEADAPFCYPATLVDIDIDGLKFCLGTMLDDLENSTTSYDITRVVGLTGVSTQYQLVPFDFNLSQTIKAVVMLSLDDADLFKRLWANVGDTAVRRGDAMICKAFLKAKMGDTEDVDWSRPLEHLRWDNIVNRKDIDKVRREIIKYAATKVKFLDGDVGGLLELFRLIGILERVPAFIAERRRFVGYYRMFGTSIDFINEYGVIEDSVPLHEHLLLSTSYEFHDHTVDISRRNRVATRLLQRIRRAVDQKMVRLEEMMPLDSLQARIFEDYQVFVPVHPTATERELGLAEMFSKNRISRDGFDRTLKFGRSELGIIADVFVCLPKGALEHVSSLTKKLSDAKSIHALRSNTLQVGVYNPAEKRITISIPVETPHMPSGISLMLEMVMGHRSKVKSMKLGAGDVELHRVYFMHTLLHEVGESIWAHLPEEMQAAWSLLTPEEGKPRELFLTPYSKKAPNEDFCECFALYMVHGAEFRRRARKYPAIGLKYEFIRKIWCADDEQRTFNQETSLPISAVHGEPADDPDEAYLREVLEEVCTEDSWVRDHERVFLGREVISYETLAEAADAQGHDSIERAARDHGFTEEDEAYENLQRAARVGKMVGIKYELALVKLGVVHLALHSGLYNLIREGRSAEAVELLRNEGAKPKKLIAPTVNRLIRLYQYFAEDLESAGGYRAESEMSGAEFEDRIKVLKQLLEGEKPE